MGTFRMPSLGADMESGTVVEWRVHPGDEVHRGDIVAVIDTEKSTIEVEVFEDGVVEELLVAEGDEVPVGTPLATLGAGHAAPAGGPASPIEEGRPDEEPPVKGPTVVEPRVDTPRVVSPLVRHRAEELHVDLATVTGTGVGGSIRRADVEHAVPAPSPGPPAPAPVPVPPPVAQDRVRASPRARRQAAEEGIDLARVTGSGPGGAVLSQDLGPAPTGREAAAPVPSQPVGRDLRASRRASIGALMARSKREIPHYYVSSTVDLAAVHEWLARENDNRAVGDRLLTPAVLLTAVARAAVDVPVLNGHFLDGSFRAHDGVDLGVAVSLRGGGLIAPAIHDAQLLDVDEMMAKLRDLVPRARAGVLRSSEMTDPTLTVTNLGDQGVEVVLPVIYPPQVAMVGLGTIVERPWAVDGMLTIRPVVTVTLAADHRATDGHDGARFLNVLNRLLQQPEELRGG